MPNTRKKAEKRGRNAELLARIYLRLKGYRILAHRFRSPYGEIDIIAKRGKTLVFVEVKARKSVDDALYSIAYKQRRRIEAASEDWLKKHKPVFKSIRFDIIAVASGILPTHIHGAWRLGE
ncbi:YraN family protein [Kordiimonas pumila]|uniref:UPF0102 protein ACFOKA_17405 n=1 Tax=Kordiimonas pumila TaxID=2161677 RepID=A0ABV7DA28_9PROT|nr:YraN family protein [Kordiimonas pumila]